MREARLHSNNFNPLRPDWSPRIALAAQVEKEDLIRWSLSSEERPLLEVHDTPSRKKISFLKFLALLLP